MFQRKRPRLFLSVVVTWLAVGTTARAQVPDSFSDPVQAHVYDDVKCVEDIDACATPCNRWWIMSPFRGLFPAPRHHSPLVDHLPYPAPMPLGAVMHSHFQTQVDNGLASRLVVYRFDFYNEPGTNHSLLNPYGIRRLQKIAPLLMNTFQPLIVEEVIERPQLNQARREQVLQQLAALSLPIDSSRVIIGRAPTPGLDGNEAIENHGNLLRQTVNGPKGMEGADSGGSRLIGASGSGVESGN